MALSAHLESLQNKHGEIDQQLAREMRSLTPDNLKVAQLKKQKLQIKDTMTQMGAKARS